MNLSFYNKEPSKYITDEIDRLIEQNKITEAIDIGCGGGRYSKYLSNKNVKVIAIDKNKEMFKYCEAENIENIEFKVENMDNLEEQSNSCNLILSIGAIHNSTNMNEYQRSFKEIYRVLKNDGYAIISIFTSDVITKDLSRGDSLNLYLIRNRPPMILLSKGEIEKVVKKIGFKFIKIVDEHTTEVGDDGKRNVWTILLRK